MRVCILLVTICVVFFNFAALKGEKPGKFPLIPTSSGEKLGKLPLTPDTKKLIRRIGFRSNGCSCQQLICGCCLGINLEQFNFNREGCMNFTYYPQDFAVGMDVYMNENNVFSNAFSAKNPPPLCIPIPIPYIPIDIQACARLYDIYTPGANLHMCLDFETRIEGGTLLVLHFDCMRMGLDGVAGVKPGVENAGITTSSTMGPPGEEDVYDEVTEIKTDHKQKGRDLDEVVM
ncbi:unnamed protein product [Acanthoscelides obtectus]|uniref:DUF4773 domain-containing protein n=1 Tax=Acanthoscelides obtectus TaxID=200917 RepID=A0A9P0L148_ACAOB|nr:unnamed protein product [Acanthoscelides obtectus]CAK1664609.1 hypothetical protein AOBTE_LOCUS24361 [Acanthoscelides obtectus]